MILPSPRPQAADPQITPIHKLSDSPLEDGTFDPSGVEELHAGAVVEFVDVAPSHRDHEDAFAGLVGGEVVVHEAITRRVGGRLGSAALVDLVYGKCLV